MRPLSQPAFRVKIPTNNLHNKDDPTVRQELAKSVASGHVRYKPPMPTDDEAFKTWAPTIAEVDEAYSTIEPLYPTLLMHFLSKGRNAWHDQFATEAYRKEMAMQIDVSRDALRDFDFPDIADPGLSPAATPLAATQQMLANSPGLVIGNEHGDQAPHDLLHAALDSGDLGLVFIEELDVLWQPMIDEYLDSPADEFPPLLGAKLKALQDTFKLDFAGLLRKTKQKGARLYGIDAPEAHYYEAADPRHHEDRNASMNRVSDDVIKGALRKYPGRKFAAVCGEAHSNTSPGGIPGIAQLVNAPAVKFNAQGKLQFEAEDRANRTMPPKEVQSFVDQFSLKLMKDYKALKDKDNKLETMDPDEVHEVATRVATQLQQAGRLGSVKDVAKALKRTETEQALQRQIALTQQRTAKRDAMRQAINGDDAAALDRLLSDFRVDDPYGAAHEAKLSDTTLLHYAANNGKTGCIDKLTAMGCDVQAMDSSGRSCLQMAVAANSPVAVDQLIQAGVHPDLGADKGQPALWSAARNKDPRIVSALLAAGANPNRKFVNDEDGYGKTDGRSALHMAITSGDLPRVQALIDGGADLSQLDGKGKTPLQRAVEEGLLALIAPLVAGGADPDQPNGQGQTAMHVAAGSGALAALDALQAQGGDIDSLDAAGNTPLLAACALGQAVTAARLLQLGADALAVNARGEKALHLAAGAGLDAIVTDLIDHKGAVLADVDGTGNNALHHACRGDQATASGVGANLLQRATTTGLSLDTRNGLGETALHLAAVRGDDALAGSLMGAGASATVADNAGLTALEKALLEKFRSETRLEYAKTKAKADPELIERELLEVGTALAQGLIQAVPLTRVGEVAAIGTNQDFIDERDNVIRRTKTRAQTFEKAKNAMNADNLTATNGLASLMAGDPGLLYFQDAAEGRGLVHYAALMRKPAAVKQLAAGGADVNATDKAGNTAFHAACQSRDDDPAKRKGQADVVEELLATPGIAPNAKNAKGWTACHFAAWNGNDQALATMFDARNPAVDDTITDDRGWTPHDVVVASTKKDAEAMFHAKGKAPTTPLIDPPGVLSTIDILMKATKCENPSHIQMTKDSYEAMYADPKLRPILDLVALDACAPRVPPNFDKGLRIFIADHDHSGDLWNSAAVSKTPARGAIDEQVNVMQVSAKKSMQTIGKDKVFWDAKRDDFAGCLVHEMTHCAARIVYGKSCEPFGDDTTKNDYLQAINKTVARTNLLCKGNEVEEQVRDRVTGRMDHYVGKGNAEHELLMEHIVSVPQLIAQFGEANVRDQIGDLQTFFEDFTGKCTAKAKSSKFTAERGFVDTAKNKQLETSLATKWPTPPKKEAVVEPGRGQTAVSLDELMEKVQQQLHIEFGQLDTSKVGVAYKPGQFVITDGNRKKLVEDRCKLIRKGLAKTFTNGELPAHMLTSDFRGLIDGAVGLVKDNATPAKSLESAMNAKSNGWLRDAKVNYVENAIKEKTFVEPRQLAEAIILKAEKTARGGGPGAVIDFGAKKHLAAVAQLSQDLESIPFDKQFEQSAIFADVSDALSTGDDTGGFYKKKPKRFGRSKPNHVSIKLAHAKREWVAALQAL